MTLEVWRDGASLKKRLTTAVYPPAKAAQLARQLLGITVEDINPALQRRYGIGVSSGVVITAVEADSFLGGVGVEPGDVIRQVGDAPVHNHQAFEKAMIKHRLHDAVVILVQRGRQGYYITVEF
jgi:serine protease Do